MWRNKTEEDFDKLEQQEWQEAMDALAIMLILLRDCKDDIIDQLNEFYRKYGHDKKVTYAEARRYISNKNRRRRITVLLASLDKILEDAVDEIDIRFSDLMKLLNQTECEFFELEPEEEPETETVPWGTDEKTWRERLWDDKALWLAYLMTDIKRSMIRGHDLDAVINQINKRFTTMENVLERLVGTETTAMTSLVRNEIFKELGIDKYQFFTRADERVCETCGPMHGMIFRTSEYEVGVTASPIHPNCRCWEVPIVGD